MENNGKYYIHRPNKWDSNAIHDYKKENYVYTELNDKTYAEETLSDVSIQFSNEKKIIKTNRFPRFSSFWHNENDYLPEIVIASINSFLNVNYEYNLYTYKYFKNIPDGCIIKDANEIIPFEEFYLGSRNDYASFADYFRIKMIEKVDTAWTDTDNFYLSDEFDGNGTVLLIHENRIQNGFFYISNDEESLKFKKLLIECYNNVDKILYTDSEELKKAKMDVSKYNIKKDKLKNAKWGFGGSCLFTSSFNNVDLKNNTFEYNKYFNGLSYQSHYKYFVVPKKPYMDVYNKDVKLFILSTALLVREPWIIENFNEESYVSKVLKIKL